MSLWFCETLDGPVGVHIEDGNVAARTPNEAGYERLLHMTPDQAIEMSRAMEQVAFQIQRRFRPPSTTTLDQKHRTCAVCGDATDLLHLPDGFDPICKDAGACLQRLDQRNAELLDR